MAYKITKLSDLADLDTLPVMKVAHYPLEQRDYRPFAQAVAAAMNGGLLVRLWAFEAEPSPESELAFALAPESEPLLLVRVAQNGRKTIALGGQEITDQAAQLGLSFSNYDGEDLQGVYWGFTLHISREGLEQLWHCNSHELSRLWGNFYKICERDPEWIHYGSCFPADFPADPFGWASLGELDVIDY